VSLDLLDILQLSPPFGGAGSGLPVVTSYRLAGPSSGFVGLSSDAFVVTLGYGFLAAPVTITPNDSSAGGSFAPSSVTLTDSIRSASFAYVAASPGDDTIGTTDDGGLSDPASLPYAALALPSGGTDAGATIVTLRPRAQFRNRAATVRRRR
jgi:hypothetical protein